MAQDFILYFLCFVRCSQPKTVVCASWSNQWLWCFVSSLFAPCLSLVFGCLVWANLQQWTKVFMDCWSPILIGFWYGNLSDSTLTRNKSAENQRMKTVLIFLYNVQNTSAQGSPIPPPQETESCLNNSQKSQSRLYTQHEFFIRTLFPRPPTKLTNSLTCYDS